MSFSVRSDFPKLSDETFIQKSFSFAVFVSLSFDLVSVSMEMNISNINDFHSRVSSKYYKNMLDYFEFGKFKLFSCLLRCITSWSLNVASRSDCNCKL